MNPGIVEAPKDTSDALFISDMNDTSNLDNLGMVL